MVGRNGSWYTDMGSSPGSASSEFWDLEQAMESAELLCFFTVPSGTLTLCRRLPHRGVLRIMRSNEKAPSTLQMLKEERGKGEKQSR